MTLHAYPQQTSMLLRAFDDVSKTERLLFKIKSLLNEVTTVRAIKHEYRYRELGPNIYRFIFDPINGLKFREMDQEFREAVRTAV